MEIINRIQKMLKDGMEAEARDLYFTELAPLLDDFYGTLDKLLDHETKKLDHDRLWRRILLSFEALNSLEDEANDDAPP